MAITSTTHTEKHCTRYNTFAKTLWMKLRKVYYKNHYYCSFSLLLFPRCIWNFCFLLFTLCPFHFISFFSPFIAILPRKVACFSTCCAWANDFLLWIQCSFKRIRCNYCENTKNTQLPLLFSYKQPAIRFDHWLSPRETMPYYTFYSLCYGMNGGKIKEKRDDRTDPNAPDTFFFFHLFTQEKASGFSF